MIQRLGVVAFHLTLVAVAGCGGSLPQSPESWPVTMVQGKLLSAGQPCGPGWLILAPMGKTVGDHVVVPVNLAGDFVTEKAPLGDLHVRVKLTSEAGDRVVARGQTTLSTLKGIASVASPLRLEGAPQGPAIVEIDLATLAVRRIEPGR